MNVPITWVPNGGLAVTKVSAETGALPTIEVPTNGLAVTEVASGGIPIFINTGGTVVGGDTITNFTIDNTTTPYKLKITTDKGSFETNLTGLQRDFTETPTDIIFTNSDGTFTTISKAGGASNIYDITKTDTSFTFTENGVDKVTVNFQGLLSWDNATNELILTYGTSEFRTKITKLDTLETEIATKVSTSNFDTSQEIQNNRIADVEEDLTTLQQQLSAVILEETNAGPEPLTTTPVSILTFPTVTNGGKYNGAMRATWTGSGTRDINLTIYINGVATSRTATETITDNKTTSLFTATPLDLVEGDIVEVYASSTTGSVSAIAGALQLVLSNNTVDLSEYVTNASYIPEQEAQDTRISQLQLDVSDLGTGLSNNTSAISANTSAIADLQSMSVESINFFTYFKANNVDNLNVSGYVTSGKIFKSDLDLIGTTQGDNYGVVKNATLFGSFIMNQNSTGVNYFAPCFDIAQVSTVAGVYSCKMSNLETGEFVGYVNVPFNGINPVVGALFITVADAVIVGDLEFQGAYLKPSNEGKYAVDFQLYITSIEYK